MSSNKNEIIIRENRFKVFLDIYKHDDNSLLRQTSDLLLPELTLDFPKNHVPCQHENTIHKAYKFDSSHLSEKLKVEIQKQMNQKHFRYYYNCLQHKYSQEFSQHHGLLGFNSILVASFADSTAASWATLSINSKV